MGAPPEIKLRRDIILGTLWPEFSNLEMGMREMGGASYEKIKIILGLLAIPPNEV